MEIKQEEKQVQPIKTIEELLSVFKEGLIANILDSSVTFSPKFQEHFRFSSIAVNEVIELFPDIQELLNNCFLSGDKNRVDMFQLNKYYNIDFNEIEEEVKQECIARFTKCKEDLLKGLGDEKKTNNKEKET